MAALRRLRHKDPKFEVSLNLTKTFFFKVFYLCVCVYTPYVLAYLQ